MNWREVVTVDPNVCNSQACFLGTRILVSFVLDNLAAGLTPAELQAQYPSLATGAIPAALASAAELASESVVADR